MNKWLNNRKTFDEIARPASARLKDVLGANKRLTDALQTTTRLSEAIGKVNKKSSLSVVKGAVAMDSVEKEFNRPALQAAKYEFVMSPGNIHQSLIRVAFFFRFLAIRSPPNSYLSSFRD